MYCKQPNINEEIKIFDPDSEEEVLKGWLLHAHKGRDRHDEAARLLDKKHYYLGSAAVVLSAIVGASIITSLETEYGLKITIFIGLLSIASSALAGIQTVYNYAERRESHRVTGVRYKAIIRELEEILARRTQKLEFKDSSGQLKDLRNRLDAIEKEAPVVPHWIYDKIERKYKHSSVKFERIAKDLYKSS